MSQRLSKRRSGQTLDLLDGDRFELEQMVEGESVSEVLDYVQFHETVWGDRMRRQHHTSRHNGWFSVLEANLFLCFYQEVLSGYTYLEEETPALLINLDASQSA